MGKGFDNQYANAGNVQQMPYSGAAMATAPAPGMQTGTAGAGVAQDTPNMQTASGAQAIPNTQTASNAQSAPNIQDVVNQQAYVWQNTVPKQSFADEVPGFEIDRKFYRLSREIAEEKKAPRSKAYKIAGYVAAAVIIITGTTIAAVSDMKKEAPVETIVTAEPEPEVVETDDLIPQSMDGLGSGEKDAIRQAQSFLNSIPYSKKELIEELQSEYYGYSEEDATAAVNYLESAGLVDFKEEAAKWATTLVESSSYSRARLINSLSGTYSADYTEEEAEYAVSYLEDNNLVDWKEEAKEAAGVYLELSDFSGKEMKEQLTLGENFTQEEAQYAVDALGLK